MAEIKSSWAVCSVCGKEFEIIGNRKKYCSKACCAEASRKKSCERGKARYRALTAEQKKAEWEKRKRAMPKKKKAAREPKYQNEIARIAAEARKLGMSYGEYVATENVRKYVEKMCKIDDADEDCRWIPVTERLPEDESDVLTTIASKSGSGYREYSVGCYIKVFDEDEEKHWLDRQYGYLEWDRYSNGHGGCSLYKVTAWMPLPKLYKG